MYYFGSEFFSFGWGVFVDVSGAEMGYFYYFCLDDRFVSKMSDYLSFKLWDNLLCSKRERLLECLFLFFSFIFFIINIVCDFLLFFFNLFYSYYGVLFVKCCIWGFR